MVDARAQAALAHVRALSRGGQIDPNASVTIHFHPDAPFGDTTVIESLAREGIYRSQFETGTGNGGLTAVPGGDRYLWESRLFGGHYDDAEAALRPKYWSLDLRRDGFGGSPRFGSSYLRLNPAVLQRSTFCFPDSVFGPTHFGTARRFGIPEPKGINPSRDPLDDYIEAHVHGVLELRRDVEAIVLDPSYRGTPIEAAARKLGCPVHWHQGFAATGTMLHQPGYRGKGPAELASRLAGDGELDPSGLGHARLRPGLDPQELKKVWHLLARYGRKPGGP
ncbi:DUF3626 domain-containing protein [Paeniglutamicibacter psychrophenolicus]|uniref:DUF3626 domain-containing protein n=1 Tax=Paeniglutamicibacter psychrophenolicus TaxID=257454 RepID=A0ABS4WJ49_9MICC|nr:DUF3626 domain-containing protein [Paeniglutamicibacter psychrophenolicus]MBP2376232.1 hypothetical protein [Paeniglutamicibacter psychrophenolicus]